jgi:RNA polymerase sigma-70 factor, ECF subfamily
MDFEDVYQRFFDHVYRWTRALGGPDAEREDLVQDVFLIVHRRIPDFDGKNVAGWLYQITRRRVRDFRRLHWVRLLLNSSPPDESLASSAGTPEAELEAKQHDAILLRLLSKLPEAQRAAFVLFEIDGYSGEEIARLQDVPINTVWARVKKARAKLAASITRLNRHG